MTGTVIVARGVINILEGAYATPQHFVWFLASRTFAGLRARSAAGRTPRRRGLEAGESNRDRCAQFAGRRQRRGRTPAAKAPAGSAADTNRGHRVQQAGGRRQRHLELPGPEEWRPP